MKRKLQKVIHIVTDIAELNGRRRNCRDTINTLGNRKVGTTELEKRLPRSDGRIVSAPARI